MREMLAENLQPRWGVKLCPQECPHLGHPWEEHGMGCPGNAWEESRSESGVWLRAGDGRGCLGEIQVSLAS